MKAVKVAKVAKERPIGTSKTCSRCKVHKPRSEFGTCDRTKDWLRAWCLQCQREYARSRKNGSVASVASDAEKETTPR